LGNAGTIKRMAERSHPKSPTDVEVVTESEVVRAESSTDAEVIPESEVVRAESSTDAEVIPGSEVLRVESSTDSGVEHVRSSTDSDIEISTEADNNDVAKKDDDFDISVNLISYNARPNDKVIPIIRSAEEETVVETSGDENETATRTAIEVETVTAESSEHVTTGSPESEDNVQSAEASEPIEEIKSRNANTDEVVTSEPREEETTEPTTEPEDLAQKQRATELEPVTEEEPATTESVSPFMQSFLRMNITITACNTSGENDLPPWKNETMTLEELFSELNVTTDEVETTFEEIGDTLTEAVNSTIEAFGSLFSGMLDVMSSPMPEIQPLISVNTQKGGDPFNIPGIFSVNTLRKDGALLSVEEGDRTRVRIPGILHLQMGEGSSTAPESKTSAADESHASGHLFHIAADEGGARIRAPFLDLKFGQAASKVILN